MIKNKIILNMNFTFLLCMNIIFLLFLNSNSYSQVKDVNNESAVQINAEKAILNKESGVLSFSGKVEIFFKGYNIKSDFLTATNNKQPVDNKISLIEARGNVFISNNKDIIATGDTLTFNVKEQFILVEGDVKLSQAGSIIKGKRFYFDLVTENIEFDGNINSYIVN